ncbi:IPT/TIG domain-containing protein [Kitasatospora griseola]|uniref:IPT/TIG domain-containing protein n=1 Tax=Kitasatospora griseola TaxID=2064 RepID=UPI00382DAE73
MTPPTPTSPPSATAISPVTGPAAGGTTVTLTGTGLATANVAFGTTPAAFIIVSDTLINATAPAHTAGAVEVTVTTPGGSAIAPEPYTDT